MILKEILFEGKTDISQKCKKIKERKKAKRKKKKNGNKKVKNQT